MACTFLAAPLSGLLIQPLMGSYADASKSRYGRRRPFMLGGAAICGIAMLFLGYSQPIVSLFFGESGVVCCPPCGSSVRLSQILMIGDYYHHYPCCASPLRR